MVGVKEFFSTAAALLLTHLKPAFLEESHGFKHYEMVHLGEAAFASYSPQRSRFVAEQQQPAVQRRPSYGAPPMAFACY